MATAYVPTKLTPSGMDTLLRGRPLAVTTYLLLCKLGGHKPARRKQEGGWIGTLREMATAYRATTGRVTSHSRLSGALRWLEANGLLERHTVGGQRTRFILHGDAPAVGAGAHRRQTAEASGSSPGADGAPQDAGPRSTLLEAIRRRPELRAQLPADLAAQLLLDDRMPLDEQEGPLDEQERPVDVLVGGQEAQR